jgi:hypothetical protein
MWEITPDFWQFQSEILDWFCWTRYSFKNTTIALRRMWQLTPLVFFAISEIDRNDDRNGPRFWR